MKQKLIFFVFVVFVSFVSFLSFCNADTTGKILLVAGHGLGKDCNHAVANIDGVKYYENKEARILVDKIANYLSDAGIDYEIANEIIGDEFWSSDDAKRNIARNCNPSNSNTCCGYKTSTIGTYSKELLNYVDSIGIQNYSMVFEVHFNASKGDYTLVLGRDDLTRINGLKIANAVVESINFGEARYGIDNVFLNTNLGTITYFYQQRSIPVYYLETVFMDNNEQFRAYLKNKDKVALNLANTIIEIAPYSRGGYTVSGMENSNYLGGLYKDPYPNVFLRNLVDGEESVSCDTIFYNEYGDETTFKEFLDDLFWLIKVFTPLIIIILTVMDYIKAIISHDDSEVKKVSQKTVKRLMIGIIVFFIPYLLDLLFHLFGLYDLSRCGIGGS